jgi:ferrous iron transport protein A
MKGWVMMDTSNRKSQTLAEIKKGEHAILLSVHLDKGVASRLTSLGFTPGVGMEMTQNYGHGPIVVTLRGTRVALGRQEARNIFVEKGLHA